MDAAIVSTEIVCLIVTLIVGYALIIDKMKTSSHMHIFGCVCCVFVVLLSDTCSYVFEGNPNLNIFLTVTNVSTFIFGDLLMFFFAHYIWAIVNEKKPIKKIIINLVLLIGTADILFEIFGVITHLTLEIVDGVFVPGPYYGFCFAFQLASLVFCMIHLIIYMKVLGKRSIIIFSVYYFFPVLAIIIILINPDYSFVCSSLAISFLFVYIGIEKESKDRLMLEMANTDVLTNLNNRNSYEKRVEHYSKLIEHQNIGVLFCDVNGLKYVNDNQGHLSGDQLIIKFSKILNNKFDSYEIFRISGDEFVVILSNIKCVVLELMVKEFKDELVDNDHIASCGYAFGTSDQIVDLIMNAEKQMYDDKNEYYEKYGKNRRRAIIDTMEN